MVFKGKNDFARNYRCRNCFDSISPNKFHRCNKDSEHSQECPLRNVAHDKHRDTDSSSRPQVLTRRYLTILVCLHQIWNGLPRYTSILTESHPIAWITRWDREHIIFSR